DLGLGLLVGPHGVADDAGAAGVAVLVAQALKDASGRVPLLGGAWRSSPMICWTTARKGPRTGLRRGGGSRKGGGSGRRTILRAVRKLSPYSEQGFRRLISPARTRRRISDQSSTLVSTPASRGRDPGRP